MDTSRCGTQVNGLTGIAGCDRPHQPRDWGNATEQADALESPIQSELRGKIIGGDPVIRVVRRYEN